MNRPCFFFLCLLLSVMPMTSGYGAERVAFVVGIDDYPAFPLENAVRDATAVRNMLQQQLGFAAEDVLFSSNPDEISFLEKFETFKKRSRNADIVLLFYAGHGMESLDGKENFILPVDADVERSARSEAALRAAGINLMSLMGELSDASRGAKIVLIDACRERPAARGANRSGGGLATYSDDRIPADTLMILAAAPEQLASDGSRHGPFTQALLEVLPKGGQDLMASFFEVSDRVQEITRRRQVPWLKFDGSGKIFRSQKFLAVPAAPLEPSPMVDRPSLPGESASILNDDELLEIAYLAEKEIPGIGQNRWIAPFDRPFSSGINLYANIRARERLLSVFLSLDRRDAVSGLLDAFMKEEPAWFPFVELGIRGEHELALEYIQKLPAGLKRAEAWLKYLSGVNFWHEAYPDRWDNIPPRHSFVERVFLDNALKEIPSVKSVDLSSNQNLVTFGLGGEWFQDPPSVAYARGFLLKTCFLYELELGNIRKAESLVAQIEDPDVGEEARFYWIENLARQGQIEQASEMAASLSCNAHRFSGYLSLARGLASIEKLGERPEPEMPSRVDPQKKQVALSFLRKARAEADQITIDKAVRRFTKGTAFSRGNGNFLYLRNFAYFSLAEGYFHFGQIDEGIELLRSLNPHRFNEWQLGRLALSLYRVGFKDSAHEILSLIGEDARMSLRERTLIAFAEESFEGTESIGEIQEALASIDSTDPTIVDLIHSTRAGLYLAQEDLQKVLREVYAISKEGLGASHIFPKAIVGLGRYYISRNEMEKAINLLGAFHLLEDSETPNFQSEYRCELLCEIVGGKVLAGDIEGARSLVRTCSRPSHRFSGYLTILRSALHPQKCRERLAELPMPMHRDYDSRTQYFWER